MTANNITTTSKAIPLTMMGGEALGALYDLRWMIVLSVFLIVADFWFGTSASKRRREKFRLSRALRRTCNKFCDYIVYLILGCLLGLGLFEPLGICSHIISSAIALGVGCICEVDSIKDHICELHGVNPNKYSIKRILLAVVSVKSKDAAEALESVINEKEKENEKD